MSTPTVLPQSPSLARLYGRAVLGGTSHRGGPLPDLALALEDVAVDPAHLAAYDRVCGFRLEDRLPSTYLHVLAFPLQMALMADRAFPFSLPGLVHVRNVVHQRRPAALSERFAVQVHAERLAAHPKGAQVDLVAEARSGGETVWSGRSTYLAQGAKADAAGGGGQAVPSTGAADRPEPEPDARPGILWRVAGDTGRRYAAVSGDMNPIHLNPLAAKAFGFPRTIAHGMWAKARCLAALEGRLPDAVEVDVEFRKPLLLPSAVLLRAAPVGDGWDLALSARSSGKPHLVGTVRPG
ncbi:MAG: MaoC family dehydratase [Actinomycetes bacterium]